MLHLVVCQCNTKVCSNNIKVCDNDSLHLFILIGGALMNMKHYRIVFQNITMKILRVENENSHLNGKNQFIN